MSYFRLWYVVSATRLLQWFPETDARVCCREICLMYPGFPLAPLNQLLNRGFSFANTLHLHGEGDRGNVSSDEYEARR